MLNPNPSHDLMQFIYAIAGSNTIIIDNPNIMDESEIIFLSYHNNFICTDLESIQKAEIEHKRKNINKIRPHILGKWN